MTEGLKETPCNEACVLPKPYGRSQHCRVCHRTFGGTVAGDRHRAGAFGSDVDPRRCRTEAELSAVGLVTSDRGVWGRSAPDSATGFRNAATDGLIPSAASSVPAAPRNEDVPEVVA
ncbi:FDXHR family putative zinc-binding protein [Terrabacter terrigena]|uniref:Phage FDXHR zinc binding domain-containing protein n=1 Tax=Terrabacter terrigena TaxID=574718 RepID=A0ABW3MXE2_9MICO